MGRGISKMAMQELVATIRDRYRQSSKKNNLDVFPEAMVKVDSKMRSL